MNREELNELAQKAGFGANQRATLRLKLQHFAELVEATINEMETVKPVAWMWLNTGTFRKRLPKTAVAEHWNPLYTAPPKRKPLTEDEIDKAWRSVDYGFSYDHFRIEVARAIERAIEAKE